MSVGGGLITTGAIFGFVVVGGLIALTWVVGGALDSIDEAFGDVPRLPDEAKVAGDRDLFRGGEAMPRQSPAVGYDIAHRGSGK